MKISVITTSIRPQGLEITRKCLLEQTFKDYEWIVELNWTGSHDLNRAYNKALKRCKGELIVSLQDFIKVRPDYLQKWWDTYQKYPNSLITAPVGKTDQLDYSGDVRWDWRAYRMNDMDTVRDCKWDCWEIDNGAAPLKILKDVGGFDEELDKWWSSDNVSVGKRAHLLGYTFKCLFDNPGIAFDHDAFLEHPFRGKERPALVNLRMDEYEKNPRLNYLA